MSVKTPPKGEMEAPRVNGPGNLGSSSGAEPPKSFPRKKGRKKKSKGKNSNLDAGSTPFESNDITLVLQPDALSTLDMEDFSITLGGAWLLSRVACSGHCSSSLVGPKSTVFFSEKQSCAFWPHLWTPPGSGPLTRQPSSVCGGGLPVLRGCL